MSKSALIAVSVVVLAGVAFAIYQKSEPETALETESPATLASDEPAATVAIQAVVDAPELASVAGARSKMVSWEARSFPEGAGVDINLLRKTSDSPATYEFVRKVVADTNNDGSELWTPLAGETAEDIYLEVTCASGIRFTAGCQTSGEPIRAN